MQALIEANLSARISAVISNRPDAQGLEFAKMHGIETQVVDRRSYPDRNAFDTALAETVEAAAEEPVERAEALSVEGAAEPTALDNGASLASKKEFDTIKNSEEAG